MQKSTCIPHCLRRYDASPRIEVRSDKRAENAETLMAAALRQMHSSDLVTCIELYPHPSSIMTAAFYSSCKCPVPALGSALVWVLNTSVSDNSWKTNMILYFTVDMYSILSDNSGMFDVSGVWYTRDLTLQDGEAGRAFIRYTGFGWLSTHSSIIRWSNRKSISSLLS